MEFPENIHTIPQAASWICEGEWGFPDWNSEGMGGKRSLEFQTHLGVSALNFQRGKMTNALL